MVGRKRKKEEAPEQQEQQFLEEEAEKAELAKPEIAEEDSAAESGLSELEKAARQWQQEKEELLDRIKRKQADLDNLRRIGKLEQVEARDYALHDFLSRLLPVLDNIERALESARAADDVSQAYVEGLEMIQKQILQLLEQEGVSVIEACGTLFDPHCHHAVMQVESGEGEPGTVLEELQKGYRHRQRILRPAMVKVCQD